MELESYGDIEVCHDCYFAHHYGSHEHEGQWYAGESDTPAHRPPLCEVGDDFHVFDSTCPEHDTEEIMVPDEDGELWHEGDWTECPYCHRPGWDCEGGTGITEFTWRSCDGCGSHLGGSRYRLSLWKDRHESSVS